MQTGTDFVSQVKQQINIDAYISRFVKLKKQGKRFSGLCPFHGEKTPSFYVSPDLGVYHCFGCGKSGDLFKFVMDFERVDFNRAKEILSEYSGIPLKVSGHSDLNEKNAMYALNQKFLEFYIQNLKSDQGRQAREYLKARKISESEIEYFKLGY
ncbi:MAG TPA: CHC2 zinc finger domain-containing protein, partial [Leptospiraceae bacterium]|nr:CHC2 zinc finger domain-containing protein [Leptospiraceae bacterium]